MCEVETKIIKKKFVTWQWCSSTGERKNNKLWLEANLNYDCVSSFKFNSYHKQVLVMSRSGFGGSCGVGKVNSYHKRVRKCSSKQLSKRFQLLQWHLMQDKSSLFYKVFKVCFFPNCTIMEASESRNSSYAWKSILHGRDVLHRGTCWRIGNGHSVKIWQHSWLPIKHLTRVPSHAITSLEDAKVELLIHAEQPT